MKKKDEYIEVLDGTPVFRGTQVPINKLFECLEGGGNIFGFLDDFPTVDRGHVIGILQLGRTYFQN